MPIDDDPEYTMTKGEYDDLQLRFDITLEGAFTSLTDEERAALAAEVATLNEQAITAALSTMILNHPAEFHSLVRFQRERLGIAMQVDSTFERYLAVAEKNAG